MVTQNKISFWVLIFHICCSYGYYLSWNICFFQQYSSGLCSLKGLSLPLDTRKNTQTYYHLGVSLSIEKSVSSTNHHWKTDSCLGILKTTVSNIFWIQGKTFVAESSFGYLQTYNCSFREYLWILKALHTKQKVTCRSR